MAINQKNIKPGQQDDFLRIQDLLYLCLARWKWFVLSLVATIGVATVYLLRTPAVYTRTASVLIKEDSKGKSVSSDLESFSEFGLFQSGTNVNNELITFQSPALMTEVVKRLRLDMNYFVPGKFHRQVAYGLTLPVDVTINDLPENESAGFTLEVQPDGTLFLSDFIRNGTDLDEKDIKGSLFDSIPTPLGKIIINTTPNYVKGKAYTLYVGKSNLYNAVNSCSSNLSVSLNNEKASVIDLSFKDNSTQRAEDVLSMLISVYNENWVKDKNQIAVSTSMFINERLGVIEQGVGERGRGYFLLQVRTPVTRRAGGIEHVHGPKQCDQRTDPGLEQPALHDPLHPELFSQRCQPYPTASGQFRYRECQHRIADCRIQQTTVAA